VKASHWYNGEDKENNVDKEMREYSSKKEIGLVDCAFCAFDCLIPEGLDRHTMEDGQEYSHNKPDDRQSGKHQDGDPDIGGLEHSPIEGKDNQLGES
jgi:hypothetical protein